MCPFTKFQVTPLEARTDPKFVMEKLNDADCRPNRDQEYYAQVQGQTDLTAAKWCDFIVYTRKGLYVERIPFVIVYWQNLKAEFLNYHFTNFIHFSPEEYQKTVWRFVVV